MQAAFSVSVGIEEPSSAQKGPELDTGVLSGQPRSETVQNRNVPKAEHIFFQGGSF